STLDPGCSRPPREGLGMSGETFDYVIVGGGSAGCVLANRLSEDRAVSVLLLEAGHNDWSPLFRIPIGTIKIGGEYDWQFQAEPDPSRNGKVDSWAAGKVLGGGSSINAMFWARGNPGDYDGWAEAGCTGWSYADVLPYFRKAESFDGDGNEWRGRHAPQHLTPPRVSPPPHQALVAAAPQGGVAAHQDSNRADPHGCGHWHEP